MSKQLLTDIRLNLSQLSRIKTEQDDSFQSRTQKIIQDLTTLFNNHSVESHKEYTQELTRTDHMSIFAYAMKLISTSVLKDTPEVHAIFEQLTRCYQKLNTEDQIDLVSQMRRYIDVAYIQENSLIHEKFIFLNRKNSDLINTFSTQILLQAKELQKTLVVEASKQKLTFETAANHLEKAKQTLTDDQSEETIHTQQEQHDHTKQAYQQTNVALNKANGLVSDARNMKIDFLKLPIKLVKAMTAEQRKQKMQQDLQESAARVTGLFNEQNAVVNELEKPVKQIETELKVIAQQRLANPNDAELITQMNHKITQLQAPKNALIKAKQKLSIVREAFERITLIDTGKNNIKARALEQHELDTYNAQKTIERQTNPSSDIARSVVMAQLDLPVGDIPGNTKKIIAAIIDAAANNCGTIIFPEMAITGYIPQDLLKHDEFLDKSDAALQEIKQAIIAAKLNITVHLGHPYRDENEEANGTHLGEFVKKLFNATSVISFNGSTQPMHQYHYKNHLAVDGVFNEGRYFVTHQNLAYLEENDQIPAFLLDEKSGAELAHNLALYPLAAKLHSRGRRLPTITRHDDKIVWSRCCEEVWHTTDEDELQFAKIAGVQAVFVTNGSPYAENKFELRRAIINDRVKEIGLPHVYVNIGGTHVNLCYGGGSFIANPVKDTQGRTTHAEFQQAAPHFVDGQFTVYVKNNSHNKLAFEAQKLFPDMLGNHYIAHRNFLALTMIMREHFKKVGLNHSILGLSGGADSALTLAIMKAALGKDKQTAFLLPSIYTDIMSNVDAALQCEELGVEYDMVFIDEINDAVNRSIASFTQEMEDKWEQIAKDFETKEGPERARRFRDWRANCKKMANENMGACIRQHNILHYFSALLSAGNMATSNSAEVVTGYYTYKDMWGALAIIGDVAKHGVYGMLAEQTGIPPQVIVREPTAELAPGQKDQDSLPPYPIIDKIIELYFHNKQSPTEIALYMNHAWELRDHYLCDLSMVNKVIRNSQIFRFKQIVGTHIAAISGASQDSGSQYPTASGYRNIVTLETLKEKMEQLTKAIMDPKIMADDTRMVQYNQETLEAMQDAGFEPYDTVLPQNNNNNTMVNTLLQASNAMPALDPNRLRLLQNNLAVAFKTLNTVNAKQLGIEYQYPNPVPEHMTEYEAVEYHFGQLFEYVVKQRQLEYFHTPEGIEHAQDHEFTTDKLQKIRENAFYECARGNVQLVYPRQQKDENRYLVQQKSQGNLFVKQKSSPSLLTDGFKRLAEKLDDKDDQPKVKRQEFTQ